ncbi:MAG TPA: thioesterase family protein, partial [Pseudomonadales bacterium]
YNGHMNMAYYNVVFDQALDEVFDDLGIGAAYVKSGGGSCFTVEVHVTYVQEVKLGDSLRVTYQLLDWDAKRLHMFAAMYNALEGYLAATSEHLSLHVDMNTRKAGPLPLEAQNRIESMMNAHRLLPLPPQVGRRIGIPKTRRPAP